MNIMAAFARALFPNGETQGVTWHRTPRTPQQASREAPQRIGSCRLVVVPGEDDAHKKGFWIDRSRYPGWKCQQLRKERGVGKWHGKVRQVQGVLAQAA